MPFILAELVVIVWAKHHGFDDRKYWRVAPRDLRLAVILLAFGLFASSVLISANVFYSLKLSIFTVIHCRFALAIFDLTRGWTRDDVVKTGAWMSVGVVALAAVTAIKFSFPLSASRQGELVGLTYALPGFISVRHFGSWVGAIAVAVRVVVMFSRKRGWSVLHFFFLVAFARTIWSGTRSALFALVLVTLWLVITGRTWPSLMGFAKFVSLAAAASAIAYLLLPDHTDSWLIAPANFESADSFSAGRMEMWTQDFNAWLASPLLGWGSGSTLWLVDIGWPHTQPHNFVLQFLISWGLVGTAAALYLLLRTLWSAHWIAVNDEQLRPLLALVYALLATSLLSGTFYYPRFTIIILGGMAILLAVGQARPRIDNIKTQNESISKGP